MMPSKPSGYGPIMAQPTIDSPPMYPGPPTSFNQHPQQQQQPFTGQMPMPMPMPMPMSMPMQEVPIANYPYAGGPIVPQPGESLFHIINITNL